VDVASLLELAEEAIDGGTDGGRRQSGGRGVEVDAALERGEVLADLVPGRGHFDKDKPEVAEIDEIVRLKSSAGTLSFRRKIVRPPE
jgi:hypothetical protein